MNAQNTINGMKSNIIPFYNEMKVKYPNINFELEGDNARAHTSKAYQAWIKSSKVPHTKHGGYPINAIGGRAPNSPDLCSIEYLFHDFSNSVYARHPKTVEELKSVANQEWSKISLEQVQRKYQHMLKVYPWVIKHDGKEFGT